jgi:threonyl-tRNA synthetase
MPASGREKTGVRLLIWHVDAFKAEPTQRGRSVVADAEPSRVAVKDALVVFAQVEQADEVDPDGVATQAAEAIQRVAAQLKVPVVVLHSFAHLFGTPSAPEVARQILDATQAALVGQGLTVSQTAFGWFNRLEISAKGHPLSRQARQI